MTGCTWPALAPFGVVLEWVWSLHHLLTFLVWLLDWAFEFDCGLFLQDNLKESCDPAKLVSDIESLVGGDCCCVARGLKMEPTSFCLDWDAFFAPLSYEIASKASGYDRCTCCPDGIFGTEGCGSEIGYCGTAPIQRSLGESCPSTADCECKGTKNECGKRTTGTKMSMSVASIHLFLLAGLQTLVFRKWKGMNVEQLRMHNVQTWDGQRDGLAAVFMFDRLPMYMYVHICISRAYMRM